MDKKATKWLCKNTKSSRGKIILSVILNVVTSLSGVYFAVIMRDLIDAAVNGNIQDVTNNSINVVMLTIVLYVTFVVSNIIQESITVNVMSNLRASLMDSLMNKDYREVRKKHSGQWVNLLFSDVKVIGEGAATIIPGIAGMSSRLIFAFILLLVMQPVLAFIYLLGGICMLIGVSLFRGRLKSLHKDVQEKEDYLHSFFQELVENLLVIKVFGANDFFSKKVDASQNLYSEARMKRRKVRLLSINAFSFVFRMGYLIALVYGGYQLINGSISYGTLTAVLHIVNQIQTPIFNLSGVLPKIYEVFASTERVMEIETYSEDVFNSHVNRFKGIEADHLKFSYGRDSVIDDASFVINQNEIVALTGISGGGKSTLFLLILGLYPVSEGMLSISTDEGELQPGNQTRSMFAYVPQGNSLFTGTIRDNIAFNKEYDEERFGHALRTADAYDFVMSLPDKDKTAIGERGMGLSEGQIQRIAIARAIYSGAQVLLLDESTSALDEITEANVLNNIKSLNDKTVLIVTHRTAALKICNKHILVEDHRIAEEEK